MNISIVIPNFNGRDLLLTNLPKIIKSVEGYKNGFIEIVVTDDASTDGSLEAVRHLLEDLIPHNKKNSSYTLVENGLGVNRGFSGNVNVGVEMAKGDIIILLNSDVVPKKGFLLPLLSHFSNPNTFAVGCMDESVENKKIVLRGRGVGKWIRGFLMHSAGKLDSPYTLWVSGGSGAFNRHIWNKLGGLQELYNPFYWEDIDLSYRAQKAGYDVIFEPKSIVTHEHSLGAIKTLYKPFHIQKIVYRNQFLFTWLNLTDKMLIVYHILWLPYHIAKALKQKNMAFFYGFFTAVVLIPKVIAYRLKTHIVWKRTDKEVIQIAHQ